MESILTRKEQKRFDKVVGNRRIHFCRKSNCVKSSVRQLAKFLGDKSTTPIENLYKKLRQNNLMKAVIDDLGNTVMMMNPKFYWDHYQQDKKFMQAFYDLGNYKGAEEYISTCREIGHYFCVKTGEYLEEYDYVVMNKHRNTVGRNDADKSRILIKF